MDFGSARPSLEAAAGFFATLTASMGRLHPFLARVRSCNCSLGSWCTSPANDRSRFSSLSEVVSASGRLSAAAVGFVRELAESFLASARRCSPPSTLTAVPEAKVEPSSADSASAIERRAGRGGSAAVSAIAFGDVDGLTELNSMRSSKDRGLRLWKEEAAGSWRKEEAASGNWSGGFAPAEPRQFQSAEMVFVVSKFDLQIIG